MSFQQIWDAFDAVANTFTAGGPVTNEGDDYQVVEGTPYVLTKLSAYVRKAVAAGPNPVYQESGSYMVSIRRPAEEGRSVGSQLADQVVDLFPRGANIRTAGGQLITVTETSAMPAIPAGDWLTIPVTVNWFTSDP